MLFTVADHHPPLAAQPVMASAHFDVTLVTATDIDEAIASEDPVKLLVKGLASRDQRTRVVAFGGCEETGLHRDGSHADRIFCAAAKLVCVDAKLFALKGGGEFARTSVSTAQRAGRATALLCADLPAAFVHREEIADCFDGCPDYLVAEPSAALSLFGCNRIDTLVPKLIRYGTGLALHRSDYPSISVRPGKSAAKTGDTPISREVFWSQFAPAALEDYLTSASRIR